MKQIFLNIIFFIVFFFFGLMSQAQPQKKIKKSEVKVALLSLASGTSKVTYEHMVNNSQSIELTAGVIGWGFDKLKESHPKGTAWRAAYKFLFSKRDRIRNPLNGFYLKPELAYSSYEYNYSPEERLTVNRVALMACLGYDWVLNWFVFDVYGGLGGAMGNSNKSNYHHGFIGFSDTSPFALTAGFRVGFAF